MDPVISIRKYLPVMAFRMRDQIQLVRESVRYVSSGFYVLCIPELYSKGLVFSAMLRTSVSVCRDDEP